jgi:hypothetical protein
VRNAYALAEPFGPFSSILEIGTRRRLAEYLLSKDGALVTTDAPILGGGTLPPGAELVIALHVLEHCRDLDAAVRDLWSLAARFLLVEVPALEVETHEQAFDDVNPGHLHHFSMQQLLILLGGTVMAVKAVRSGPWPCNRVLLRRGEVSLAAKAVAADRIYEAVACRIRFEADADDAYLGIGYSLERLLAFGAPKLPAFDTHKAPVTADFTGRLILTPRYLPTRDEMRAQYGQRCLDPWNT